MMIYSSEGEELKFIILNLNIVENLDFSSVLARLGSQTIFFYS